MIEDVDVRNFYGGVMAWLALSGKPIALGAAVTTSDLTDGARASGDVPARYGHRLLGVVLALLLVAAGGGCRSEQAPEGPSAAPSVSAPMPDARGAAEAAALDAYRGMLRTYAKAGVTANPDEPELTRYAEGAVLKLLKDGLASLRADGHVLKGEYGSSPRVVGASPTSEPDVVHLSDCLDDTTFLTYTTSGDLVDDEPGGRRSTTATVNNGPEGWRVTSFAIQKVGTC